MLWQLIRIVKHMEFARPLVLVLLLPFLVFLDARIPNMKFSWAWIYSAVAGNIEYKLRVADDWQLLCNWIKEHTPEDTVFITPPYKEDFRLRAERAIVVDFKSFAFQEKDAQEWRERLFNLTSHIAYQKRGNRYQEMRLGYTSLSEQAFMELAKKYRADFVVMEKPNHLEFPTVYENSSYILYRVSP